MSRKAEQLGRVLARSLDVAHVGTITSIADLGASPSRIHVDGRAMRYDDAITTPQVSDVVVWLDLGTAGQFVISRMAP